MQLVQTIKFLFGIFDIVRRLREISLNFCRFQWPRDVRCGVYGRSFAGIVGVNPDGGMDVYLCGVLCVVMSGRGIFDGLITRLEKSYRM
jgi:hypothetical protein